MKCEYLSSAIGLINEDLIISAQKSRVKTRQKKYWWIKYSAVAACIVFSCLIVFAITSIKEKPCQTVSDNTITSSTTNKNEYALYIPKIELPEKNSATDMIGCLYYKGNVYTQAEAYHNNDLIGLKNIMGDYLGEADGNLKEWSKQDDFEKEFASNYQGSVYSVKGYNQDFRLCIYYKNSEQECLQFLENLNGINLNTGYDLFESRLHLKGNVRSITYQVKKDANESSVVSKQIENVSNSDINSFISELCNCPFKRIGYNSASNDYNSNNSIHLYFKLNDGTTVHLTLTEGGFVGYSGLRQYYVMMSGKAFDTIYNACK